MNLPIETKIIVARFGIAAWNGLMRADKTFAKYALSPPGQRDFINTFTVIVEESARKTWKVGGWNHRDDDLPAIEVANGTKHWFHHGRYHRDGDRPAIDYRDGSQDWWINGRRHRDGDLPAFMDINGTKCWYRHGSRHRDGGRPAVIYSDGRSEWWVNGARVKYRAVF